MNYYYTLKFNNIIHTCFTVLKVIYKKKNTGITPLSNIDNVKVSIITFF